MAGFPLCQSRSLGMDMRKSVVVTGGSKGIGWEIVCNLARAGYQVFSGARTLRENIPEELRTSITQVRMDVRNEEDHFAIAEMASGDGFYLNAYVNNAGFSKWKTIEEIDSTFLNDIIATNLVGFFWGAKAAASHLSTGGSLVNISSIAGKRGSANNSAYVATKFGITGLTQSLSKELGPKGIRVNAVCPVLIGTEGLMEALLDSQSPAKGDPETFLREFTNSQSALGRLPLAQEVADLVNYLISNRSSAITGQSINVDCGVLPT